MFCTRKTKASLKDFIYSYLVKHGNHNLLVIVKFQTHSIVNFIVRQGYVVFIHSIPLLYSNFLRSRSCLSCNKFLQVSDGIVWVAFDTDFSSYPSLSLQITSIILSVSLFTTSWANQQSYRYSSERGPVVVVFHVARVELFQEK